MGRRGILASAELSGRILGAYRERRSHPRVRILMYHSIADRPENPFSVSPEAFKAQMDVLKDQCTVISLEMAKDYLASNISLEQDVVALTFDDGLMDAYLNGYPVLIERELPATFFLPTGFMNSGDERFIDWREAQEMAANGICFGSHSVRHASLASLSIDAVARELVDSRAAIEDHLDQPVKHLSYPFGTMRDFNAIVMEIARESGYECACTAVSGLNLQGFNLFSLRRTKIEQDDTLPMFLKVLDGGLDAWYWVDRLAGMLQGRHRLSGMG